NRSTRPTPITADRTAMNATLPRHGRPAVPRPGPPHDPADGPDTPPRPPPRQRSRSRHPTAETPTVPAPLRHLRIHRPLAVLAAEATGLDPRDDRIVEIALLLFRPHAGPARYRRRLDPGVPIPPAATAVHGLTDADVAGRPAFAAIAADLARRLDGADLAGFNLVRFDLPLILAEFRRTAVPFDLQGRAVVDVLRAYPRCQPRDLAAAVRDYCGRAHRRAHSASAAAAIAAVLDAIVGRHGDLPATPDCLHAALVEVDLAGLFRRADGLVV